MKTIIVPTDFSKNAFFAAQYAASLAKLTGCRVKFLHVYIVLYAGYEEKGASVKQMDWADQEAKKGMDELVKEIQTQYPDVQIDGESIRGFMIDELIQKLKVETDVHLLVMGTKGVTNVADSLFGSTTYEVLKKVSTPVLVVPQDTADFTLNHVGYFTDYNDYELESFDRMTELLHPVRSYDILHFVKKVDAGLLEKRDRWKLKMDATHEGLQISFKEVEVSQVDINAVIGVSNSNKLDLMVFTRPHKTFFQKIFQKSLTKTVANYPIVPSLFIKE